MDAANVMDLGFLRDLSGHLKAKNPQFFMLGECVHADYYSRLVREGGLDSVTNYEAYKGMYSSLKDKNYFEIAYSLNRLFGNGGILSGVATANFVDNHDVDRVASTLADDTLLIPLYLMLYTMPGIPNVYYGSEQGAQGKKGHGTDAPLRPCAESMHFDPQSALYKAIAKMAAVRKALPALMEGSYEQLFVASCQLGYWRRLDGKNVMVLFNAEKSPVIVQNQAFQGIFVEMLTGKVLDLAGSVSIPATGGMVLVPQSEAPVLDKPEKEEPVAEPRHIYDEAEEKGRTMQDYMALALVEARRAADEGEVPMGAVVVKDGEIIGRGHNRKEGMQDPTAHAEILAIRQAAKDLGSWRLDGCELYVTAEPCPMCMGAIIQAHIKKLVYGTWEKRFGSVETTAQLGQHPMLPRDFEVYSGICEDECQDLLTTFFERNRL